LYAQGLEWEEIVGPEGQYRVEMPKGYKYETGPGGGGRAQQYRIAYPSGFGFEFAVTDLDNDNPLDPTVQEDHLRLAMEAAQQRWPGSTVVEQEPLWLGPARGRSMVLSVQKNTGVLIMRVYVTLPRRLYAQLVLARNDERNNPAIDRFLNSLRLKG
jgi:hypothetical protein